MTGRSGDTSSDTKGMLAVVGLGAAMLVCCVGPVLLGAGALGALGGALRSPWLIGGAILLALSALAYTVYATVARLRRRGRDGAAEDAGACCPPVPPRGAGDRVHDDRTGNSRSQSRVHDDDPDPYPARRPPPGPPAATAPRRPAGLPGLCTRQ